MTNNIYNGFYIIINYSRSIELNKHIDIKLHKIVHGADTYEILRLDQSINVALNFTGKVQERILPDRSQLKQQNCIRQVSTKSIQWDIMINRGRHVLQYNHPRRPTVTQTDNHHASSYWFYFAKQYPCIQWSWNLSIVSEVSWTTPHEREEDSASWRMCTSS